MNTLLIIEDNLINQKVISTMLNLYKIDYQIAGTGKTALDLLETQKYCLVFLDCHLPDISGIEIAKTVRGNPNSVNATTPIVAFTADTRKENELNCKNAGMNDFLTKPLQLETLVNKLGSFGISLIRKS